MDAVNYLKARNKMTNNCFVCGECPLQGANNGKGLACEYFEGEYPDQAVAIVKKWLAEHPPVTYASKMREVFPRFKPNYYSCLARAIGKERADINCDFFSDCTGCWNREYGSLED
jgi:hypothetical protein